MKALENELKAKMEELKRHNRQLQAVSNPLDRMAPLTQPEKEKRIETTELSKRERDPKDTLQEEEPKPKMRTLVKLDSPPPVETKPVEIIEETPAVDTNQVAEVKPSKETKSKRKKKVKKPEVVLDSHNPSQYIEWVPPKGMYTCNGVLVI